MEKRSSIARLEFRFTRNRFVLNRRKKEKEEKKRKLHAHAHTVVFLGR